MNKRYLLYLDNKKNFTPVDCKNILLKLRSISESYADIEIRDIRISSYFIELDISIRDTQFQIQNIFPSFDSVGSMIYLEELNDKRVTSSLEDAILTGIFLFNTERYWKSHEVLENIWKDSTGRTKLILNGLILVDAAFVHLQRNEYDVFISILNRAYQKFENVSGKFYKIDINCLKENIEKILSSESINKFKIIIY